MADDTQAVEDYMAERQERIDKRLRRIAEWQVWPHHIATMLQRHVVGQDEAVRRMAVILRAHVRRMQVAVEDGTVMQPPRQRSEGGPVLLIGPSGVGKTHLIRTMAGIANLAYTIEDATSQSSTGYVGRSVSDILASLLMRAEGEVGIARWGIVGIDEVDKVRRRGTSGGLDVSGEGVQRSMLTLLEGGVIQVEWPPTGSRGERCWLPFSTANLMVVLAGAFEGLDEVVGRRLRVGRRRMGFGVSESMDGRRERHGLLSQTAPEDLIEYGLLPELVGRIRDIVIMQDLTADVLRRILVETPDGPLAMQQRVAEREGFRFVLTDDLVEAIVGEAMSRGLGARSLHSILSRVTERAMYEVPPYTHGRRQSLRTVELGISALHDGSFTLLPARRRRARVAEEEEASP